MPRSPEGEEEEEGRPQGARPKGGFLLLVGVGFPLSFPLPLQIGKGGVLLPVGVGLPPWARLLPLAGPLLPPLYTKEKGTP